MVKGKINIRSVHEINCIVLIHWEFENVIVAIV